MNILRLPYCIILILSAASYLRSQPRITYPNGSETFHPGQNILIRWEGTNPTDIVKLEYSADSGESWNIISASATGLQYKWKVPDSPSERCLIRMTYGGGSTLFEGYPAQVIDAVYSHDERIIISYGVMGVIVRDAGSGDIRWQLDEGTWAKLHPFNNTVLTVEAGGTAALRDLETGNIIDSLQEQRGTVINNARFSPDGRMLVGVGWNGKVLVWDAITGEHLRTLTGHTRSVPFVRFSNDGLRAVTLSSDLTLKVWELQSGQLLRTITAADARFWSGGLSPDGGRVVAVKQEDVAATVWDVATGAKLLSLPGKRFAVYSPDGSRIVVCNGLQGAVMYDAVTGEALHVFRQHDTDCSYAVYSSDGKRLVTVDDDGKVNLWNAQTGEFEKSIVGHKSGAVYGASFSKDGKRLLTAGEDKTVRLWYLDDVQQTTDISDTPFTIWPTTLAIPQVDLGTTPYGLSRDSTVTAVIRNPDSKPLRVENFRITGTDSMSFSLLPNLSPIDVPAGGTADLTFRFTPSGARLHQATLEMQAHGSLLKLPLRGEGVALPMIPMIPLVDFGQMTVGTIRDTVIAVVRNMTDRSIRIDTVWAGGGFSVGYGLKGKQVAAGEVLEIRLFYRPAGVFKERRPLLVVYREENKVLDTVRLDVQGEGVKPASVDGESAEGGGLALSPNPAGDRLGVEFMLSRAGTVQLLVYDVVGRVIHEELAGSLEEGEHRLEVDLRSIPAGAYLLVVETASEKWSRSLQVVR